MKASIIFITYQHEQYVRPAIRAALEQDYTNLELVICDDASKDRTVEIIEEEIQQNRSGIHIVRLYHEVNQGLIGNFNAGLKACSGDIVVLMSGDDISFAHRVSCLVKAFEENPECLLVSSNWNTIDEFGGVVAEGFCDQAECLYTHAEAPRLLYTKSPILGATAAYSRTLYDKFGPLEKFAYVEDTCFWFRAAILGSLYFIQEPLVNYRVHTASYTYRPLGKSREVEVEKHLKHIHHYQFMMKQHRQDLDTITHLGIVDPVTAKHMRRNVTRELESHRINRYSLHDYPWSLWLASAWNYFRSAPSFKFFFKIYKSKFKLRLLNSKKERYFKRILAGPNGSG